MKFVNGSDESLIDFDEASTKKKTEQEFVDEFIDVPHIFPADAKNPKYGPKTDAELAEDKKTKEAKLRQVYGELAPNGKAEPKAEKAADVTKVRNKKPELEAPPLTQ